jgi:putative transposase
MPVLSHLSLLFRTLVQFEHQEAVMAVWQLSNKEWDAVEESQFSTKEAVVLRNAKIILFSAAGCTKPSIAQDLGCSIVTVDTIRRAFRQRGLQGLSPRKPGIPSRATPEYRAALRAAVETPPQELGYGFRVWSLTRLCAHLEKQTGTRFSAPHLRMIMHQEEYSFQRPEHTMNGKRDEAAGERAAGWVRAHKERSAMTPTKR